KPFAVITGASSGIGFELAKQFAQNGFDLLIVAEDAGINDSATYLRTIGADVQAVQADLTQYDSVEDLYKKIQMSGRPLDAIALNAGVGVSGDFAHNDLRS